MPRFAVTLTNRSSGKTTADVVDADSSEDVPSKVDIARFAITKIERMKDPPPAAVSETATSVSAAFSQRVPAVFECAKLVIAQLGHKLDSADPIARIICFKTGTSWKSWAGQEVSVLFVEAPTGQTLVTVSSRRNENGVVLQIVDWGEGKSIARKFLTTLGDRLPQMAGGEAEAARPQPTSTGQQTFKVFGVDRDMAMDCSLVVKADSAANAKVKAELKGMVVTEVRPQA